MGQTSRSPAKIPAAVEELLRYDNPVQYEVRRSMREVTIRGVTIPASEPVFLLLSAANRDPEAWTNANTFDIDRNRTESQNLGFGYGIQSCLGAALARMESTIALEKLLVFMPDTRSTGRPVRACTCRTSSAGRVSQYTSPMNT